MKPPSVTYTDYPGVTSCYGCLKPRTEMPSESKLPRDPWWCPACRETRAKEPSQ